MNYTNKNIKIKNLEQSEINDASELLANSMQNNALQNKVFKNNTNKEIILKKIFIILLNIQIHKGKIYGAYLNEELVGVAAIQNPNFCRLKFSETIKLFLCILKNTKITETIKMIKWHILWNKNEPKIPHFHLGPIAIKTKLQKKGIGSLLMKEILKEIDKEKFTTYLETDKLENVEFYNKFKFKIINKKKYLKLKIIL